MFIIGDVVKFKDELGAGVVIDIISQNQVLVRTDEGFENKYPPSCLVLVKRVNTEKSTEWGKVSVTVNDKEEPKQRKKTPKSFLLKKYLKQTKHAGKKKGELFAEIDLHLEELVEFQTHLSPHEKLQLQINHFKKCIEEAKEVKIRKLIFIHGVGQGVLRTELRKMLEEQTGISYKDASFKNYGMGATEVLILGLYK
ncbi:MAG: Smr/MutS family protein [Flavobacteriales bacterium]|nr:Smr/MutS family protein [Flavobacteriales bacterium]